ncbi:MAG: hypothetical protein CML29_06420 [Rhizobiales bacterium]|nr:hypothetical protein [Hyphomicrobiales bacterium]MBA68227.1 hypothetical protein [Hyphomicrobiales bacterium]
MIRIAGPVFIQVHGRQKHGRLRSEPVQDVAPFQGFVEACHSGFADEQFAVDDPEKWKIERQLHARVLFFSHGQFLADVRVEAECGWSGAICAIRQRREAQSRSTFQPLRIDIGFRIGRSDQPGHARCDRKDRHQRQPDHLDAERRAFGHVIQVHEGEGGIDDNRYPAADDLHPAPVNHTRIAGELKHKDEERRQAKVKKRASGRGIVGKLAKRPKERCQRWYQGGSRLDILLARNRLDQMQRKEEVNTQKTDRIRDICPVVAIDHMAISEVALPACGDGDLEQDDSDINGDRHPLDPFSKDRVFFEIKRIEDQPRHCHRSGHAYPWHHVIDIVRWQRE